MLWLRSAFIHTIDEGIIYTAHIRGGADERLPTLCLRMATMDWAGGQRARMAPSTPPPSPTFVCSYTWLYVCGCMGYCACTCIYMSACAWCVCKNMRSYVSMYQSMNTSGMNSELIQRLIDNSVQMKGCVTQPRIAYMIIYKLHMYIMTTFEFCIYIYI